MDSAKPATVSTNSSILPVPGLEIIPLTEKGCNCYLVMAAVIPPCNVIFVLEVFGANVLCFILLLYPPYFIHQILHLVSSPMNFRKSCPSHLQCCPLKPSHLGRQLLYTNMKNCFNQQLVFINLTMIIWVVGLSLAIFQIDRQHMGPCDYTSLSGWNLYMRLENMYVHLSKINGTWQ